MEPGERSLLRPRYESLGYVPETWTLRPPGRGNLGQTVGSLGGPEASPVSPPEAVQKPPTQHTPSAPHRTWTKAGDRVGGPHTVAQVGAFGMLLRGHG